MNVVRIVRGLDLPLSGAPEVGLHPAPAVRRVALLGEDTLGLKAHLQVGLGDVVKRGQPLFLDHANEGVSFTAPGAGTVVGLHRGERRALRSVVIELSDTERAGEPVVGELHAFSHWSPALQTTLDPAALRALLLESGLWTALRQRPFGRIPAAAATPRACFVTAMDTQPHAPPMALALEGREADLALGLRALAALVAGPTYLCRAPGTLAEVSAPGVEVREFEGPHPAGTAGVHIHFLAPVSRAHVAWHLSAQDAAAVGALLRTGVLPVQRVVSLAGPGVKQPRVVTTRLGASVDDLTQGGLVEGPLRVLSGSVLHGRVARGEVTGYLGRYHAQVTALVEEEARHFLGWLAPGLRKFSAIPTVVSKLIPGRRFALTTTQHGEHRAMVPIGLYERVMPMDILPTHLLRALAMGDLESAEALGALELDEEDLALCSFVCPGKSDWGAELRKQLDVLEREG